MGRWTVIKKDANCTTISNLKVIRGQSAGQLITLYLGPVKGKEKDLADLKYQIDGVAGSPLSVGQKCMINENYKTGKLYNFSRKIFKQGDVVEVIKDLGNTATVKPSGKGGKRVHFGEEVDVSCLSPLPQ